MLSPESLYKRQGFSLIEAVTALSIVISALGLAMGGYMFLLKNRNKQLDQDTIDSKTQMAVARLQRELRLSSLSDMVFYPSDAKKFTALSFPVPASTESDGNIALEPDGAISWGSTVIYHAFGSGSDMELLRTEFSPRDASLTTQERQVQLNQVVADGHGNNALNGSNASTSRLFENVFEWEIIPQGSSYDGYSEQLVLNKYASLGVFNLGPGAHTLKLEVAGKKSQSTGYKIGVDTIRLSTAGLAREAEAQSIAGSPLPFLERNASGIWSGGYQLTFPATGKGAVLSMDLYNDRWEDTNFDLGGSIKSNTTVGVIDESYSPADFALRLVGNTTNWSAKVQTMDGDLANESETGGEQWDDSDFFRGAFVRVILRGADMTGSDLNADPFDHDGAACRIAFRSSSNGDLSIDKAYIAECASTENEPLIDEASSRKLTFEGDDKLMLGPGGIGWSELADFPIAWDKSYVVSFSLSPSSHKSMPHIWNDQQSNSCSFAILNAYQSGFSSLNLAKNWTSLPSGLEITSLPFVVAVEKVHTTYPHGGTYTSPPVDTTMDAPQLQSIDWLADIPAGANVSIKARSANQPDMSDAADWGSISTIPSPGSLTSIQYKRYIQYQVTLESNALGRQTPKLRNLSIQWPGELRSVDVGGAFVNGPEYGQFEATIDDQPLVSPLSVTLKLEETVRGLHGSTQVLQSKSSFKINPRNTRRSI